MCHGMPCDRAACEEAAERESERKAAQAVLVGGDWNVTYGPSVPTAVPRRRKRDPHCAECGRSTDARFGGHHPGCPNG